MNDDVKAAVGVGAWDSASGCSKDEWYAIGRLKMNNACDAPDVDPSFWEDLSLILAHIDGEPARIAAKGEEVREACARHIWAMSRRPTAAVNPPAQASTAALFRAVAAGEITPEQASDTVVARKAAASTRFQRPTAEELMEMVGFARSTPLTATPLGDALRLANENIVKMAQASTEAQASAAEGVRYWTDLAQAEARDAAALRARVAELEAQRASSQRHMNGRESYWVEQRTKWIAECDRIGESCKWHAARAEKAEAERDALKLEVESLARDMVAMTATANAEVAAGLAMAAERDALRAQVEAARTYARQALDYGEDCDATDLLAAMDEAKP